MIDLKAYQEAMAIHLKKGELQDTKWLYKGMDSILQIMLITFPEHRKFEPGKTFEDYYRVKLSTPWAGLGKAIQADDSLGAMQQYDMLVKGCNSCHKDTDVSKKVYF